MKLSLLVLLTTFLSGCVSNTVDLAYRPEAGRPSPLSVIKPLVFAVEVDDRRDVKDRDRVAARWHGMAGETPITATRDVVLVLKEALTAELENNGHRVRPREDASADAALRFLLTRYWCCEMRILGSFESGHIAATIQGNVEILNAQNERLMSKPISSTHLSVPSRQQLGFDVMLNGVLAEFVRNLARDPSMVDALRRVQREHQEISQP